MINFSSLVFAWIAIGILTFIVLVAYKIKAPYGRHTSSKWGLQINNRLGWFLMELPALMTFPLLALFGPSEKNWLTYLLITLWLIHYLNRTLVFPLRIQTKGKKMPIAIMFSAIGFNLINGFLNGYFIGYISSPDYDASLSQVNVLAGLFLFVIGIGINVTADSKLIALRKNNSGYQIPKGWLFEYISCPNHFGEIIEWTGFALLAWNLPALSFAIWTCCNLIPRALNHHHWYPEYFSDYPTNRKAVIPFLL